ncbi:MAG TPA: methyltransferase domain-containing protein, partial [Chloroflexota bacterium]|nr:methyltransferase domain-containing protein [Chloroflexota bacterium]
MNVAEYEAMYRLEDRLWWYVGMRRVAERVLDGRLERVPQGRTAAQRILDAGCGTGGNLRWLEAFGSVYGIDLSAHAIGFCRQRGLQTVARGSVTALPYADRSFDLITSFDVIYHLGVEDDLAALREMHRVLRPGGHLLVRVPAIPQLASHHDAAVHTRQRYTLGELREKTERAGFEVLRASYANTLLFPLAAIARLMARVPSPASRVPSRQAERDSEPRS